MPSTASPISDRAPFPCKPYVLSVLSKPKKSVVRIPAGSDDETTISGGRLLSGGRKPPFAANNDIASANFPPGALTAHANDSPSSCLNFFLQSKVAKRLTITSPTSVSAPIPPPVPVVITHLGEQS